MKYSTNYFLLLSISLVLLSCSENQPTEEVKNQKISQTSDSLKPQPTRDTIAQAEDSILIKKLSIEILSALKNNDLENFANYFHPSEGVRFSPYAFIDTINDVRLSLVKFREGLKLNEKFTWGYADGSGEAIEQTIPAYFKKFVYNADYLAVNITAVNKQIGAGNSLNNLEKIYPGTHFYESFDPGKHEMAWSALRLVFQKKSDKFYLVGVVHDQWTI